MAAVSAPSAASIPPETALDQLLRREGWSLHERLRVAPLRCHASAVARSGSVEIDLEAWRRVVAPDSPGNFDKRLQWDGLTHADAAWALNPAPGDVPKDPAWWSLLEQLRNAARHADPVDGLAERATACPFVHAWRPVAIWALQQLQQRCAVLSPRLQLTTEAWLDLGEALLERLCNTADQALWELFNQRRTPGQMLLAHLGAGGDGQGEPVHEAYDAFIEGLLADGYGELLGNYPVLGRLLATVVDLWQQGNEEMLERLAESREELQQHFQISDTAPLTSIRLGLSDPHRGGRAVAILDFAAKDEARRVVYKPKDMQVDLAYQQFLTRLNHASNEGPMRCLMVVRKSGYGFMEWVEHRLCDSDAELAHFYRNAGRTMAVLHVLGCTDCHYENLIASGDQLVLIDTETLLEAVVRDLISDNGDDPDALSELRTSMQGSVLRSGLLPQWLMVGAGRKRAFDNSALGIQPPPAQLELPGWLGLNSDGMMAGRRTVPCELPTSLPVAVGSPQRLTDFVDELCAGFAEQLQELIRYRPVLQEALLAFSGLPRRLVARDTRLYFTIQRQMLEPVALRSAVAHGLRLEQLSRSFVLASEQPLNWPMFHSELIQMERLDIPFFEHLIDGETLPLPDGLTPISGFMKASGLESAQCRLQRLDQAEIAFQQQLIRGAIAARHLRTSSTTRPLEMPSTLANNAGEYSADLYKREAFRLGEELWSESIRDRKGRPEWLGMDLVADGEFFHFGLIGPSLYSGWSGIALFFARLALASEGAEADQWRQRAWACFEGLAELAERNSNDQLFRLVRDLPYGFNGGGGILLALRLLGQAGVAGSSTLLHQLLLQFRAERLLADEGVDLIGGVTGLIGPLLLMNTPECLDLAIACGDRLVELQTKSGGWSPSASSSSGRRPALTGFSHGAAGMAAALARLAQASGEARFAESAQRAVAYERSVFISDQGNWPDFRGSKEPNEFMLSWCHGAPGIMMSRQVLLDAGFCDEHTSAELDVARSSTLSCVARLASSGANEPSHLCCGLLGLTSLLRVDAALGGTQVDDQVIRAESTLIKRAQATQAYIFFAVDNGSLNLPGLLTGKAGVGLALMEAADRPRWLAEILSAGLLIVNQN
jgi:type 2 lantibiotic biosynthesis protein LanM